MATLLDIFIGLVILLVIAEVLTLIVESILQKKSKNSFTFSDRTMDELDFLCGSDRENQKDFIAELIRTEAEILDNYRRSDVCQHERLTLQPNGEYKCDMCGIQMDYVPPFQGVCFILDNFTDL